MNGDLLAQLQAENARLRAENARLESLVQRPGRAMDIAECERVEEALRESEERFSTLMDNLPVAVFIQDANSRNVYFNRYVAEHFGDWTGKTALDLFPAETARQMMADDRRVLTENCSWVREESVPDGNGQPLTFQTIKFPIKRAGKPSLIGGFAIDITDHKRAEAALRFTQFAVDHTGDAAYWMRRDGRFIYVNEAACRSLGYSREELLSMSVPDVGPTFPSDVWDRHWQELRERGNLILENLHQAKDGRIFPVEIRANFVVFGGEEYNCAFVREITERKRAEEQIKASLQEKEVLLKEIHHRVKNNLQIIYSLLDLQASQTDHPNARNALKDSQSRIRSMALIHERLYRSENLAQIDFAAYLDGLVSSLFHSYVMRTGTVGLRIDVSPLLLSIDKAVPCGLIVNELVTNALRHGFPDGHSGAMGVQMRPLDNRRILLRIWDTGIGFPVGLDFRQTTSLGLMIVNTLVGQLRGSIDLHRENGTEFRIVFTDDAATD